MAMINGSSGNIGSIPIKIAKEIKMKKIREKVFETNSSSTHSISIANNYDGILDSIMTDDDGKIFLSGGEFGWQWEKFNDALTKANYCAVEAKDDPAKTKMLVDVLMEHTGAKKLKLSINDDSYIDHDSVGIASEAFVNSEILKNFIFNPKSWLFLGNDNDDSPPNFYDVDENIRYTHELKIAGGIESARFVNLPSEDSLKESLQSLIGRHPLCAYDHDNYYEPFKFIDYNNVSIGNENIKDGTEFSSFDDIKNGNIILYKLETVYENKKGKYLGEKILESRKIKFTVSEILN